MNLDNASKCPTSSDHRLLFHASVVAMPARDMNQMMLSIRCCRRWEDPAFSSGESKVGGSPDLRDGAWRGGRVGDAKRGRGREEKRRGRGSQQRSSVYGS
jgi:hypothetical protein